MPHTPHTRLLPALCVGALAAHLATAVASADTVEISLRAHPDTVQLRPGAPTSIWRYTATVIAGPATAVESIPGSYLGPILHLRTGDDLIVHFKNDLPEATNVHWHGLDVPADMDGYATDLVAAGGEKLISFPILNRAGTYWFHPHPDMHTANHVMAGMAGLIEVTDAESEALDLPAGEFDQPFIIQDRTLGATNQFVYAPDMMEAMAAWTGESIVINGIVDTTFDVKRRAYRLRLLNGSNARTYRLAWSDGTPITVIGSDGGLFDAPVAKPSLILAPSERAEIWVNFESMASAATRTLKSLAFNPGFTNTGGNGTAIDVATFTAVGDAQSGPALPSTLVAMERYNLADASNPTSPRQWPFGFNGEFTLNGGLFQDHIVAADEIVPCDTLEVLEVSNTVAMMRMLHPFHVHGPSFQVLSRTNSSGTTYGYSTIAPGFNDHGWKDTVAIWPGETVKLLIKWSRYAGDFHYHCHLLEHEDMGTMRTFRVNADGCQVSADLNGDGAVNGLDMALLLGAWGLPGGDIDGNQTTDAADLAALLAGWAP